MRDKMFSTVWKNGHTAPRVLKNARPIFPQYGKSLGDFSTQWKNFPDFFHAMEKLWPIFSTVWKIPPVRDEKFSTVWKTAGKIERGVIQ